MKRYLTLILIIAAAVAVSAPGVAEPAPNPPAGLTAIALDGKVSLAWQAVPGASGYKVYRGTSAGAITTLVGSPATPTLTDTATNGTTYYYAVTASDGSGESPKSTTAQAKPAARSCSSGNDIVVENCYPGTASWKLTSPGRAYDSGIEGFATATSVNAGASVGLKVNTGPTGNNVPYHIDVYRMGWYGGSHGRLVSTLPGLKGVAQPGCDGPDSSTGLVDCSGWTTTTTLTTSSSWPSGVYWLRLVREDNGSDNAILLVVRNDGSHSDVMYTVPTATYEAYNPYGGKSLYTWNSNGANTVAGTPRAVKVSYDRPYAQTYNGQNDFFGYADVNSVGFLERQGYDIAYDTSTDLHTSGGEVANHKAYVSPAHDEYWSTEMRNAVTSARNAGTGLFWLGSNQVYWRIRYEASPLSGQANRVEVCYKTSESGATDPVSPTGTWRDPAGANQPENALVGQMYIGDNDNQSFPLVVSAAEGKTRVWRHTALASQASGTSTSLGTGLMGWEWNNRASNGLEPAGVQTFSTSPVSGELVQSNGRSYINGNATPTSTLYKASSGAWVVSTGTNYWSRGLDVNAYGNGEPDGSIQQATVNVLADMGTRPTTPSSGIVVDQSGAPTVTSTTPAAGGTGVPIDGSVKATFDRSIDPATVTSSTFALTPQGGSALAATVAYDDATTTATLNPSAALVPFTTYTARVKGGAGGVASWTTPLAADVTWTFTTGAGTPPKVTSTSPADGASGVSLGTTVKATFDRDMDATTLTPSTFTLRTAGGTAVTGAVSYDGPTRTATFNPSATLDPTTQYVATVSASAKASDGTAMASSQSWTFTTAAALQVTSRTPAPLATQVSPGAVVRAVFSRALDSTTLTSSTFKLAGPSGAVAGTIGYDATTTSATLTPSSQLALATTYTATVTTGVKAADGTPLTSDVTWSFSTAMTAPTAPSVTATSPAAGATGVSLDSAVTATFDRALDPTTVTGQTFLLQDAGGNPVSANVSYTAGSNTAQLTPTANLAAGKTYTAQLTTAIRASDGTPMSSAVSWTFTTANCPCSLMGSLTPMANEDVRDGRTGAGPFTYEMGTKFTVDQSMQFVAFRFYKQPTETGTHVGRLWSSSGTLLASATFANESASGWQREALASPVTLQASQTYVVSAGLNTRYSITENGLATQINSGPMHSVVGSNGVYAASAGTFPTLSWHSSNYFVDGIVTVPGSAKIPQVTSRTPVSGATDVDTQTPVTATFSTALDASTVNGSTFLLKTAGGSAVPTGVSYDAPTKTATLNPSSPLSPGASYTATLTTGIRSDDETPMAAAETWSFSTTTSVSPSVVSTSPAGGATQVGVGAAVQATFSASLDPTTVNGSTFTLGGPGGAVPATVGYDDPSKTATLTPSSALAASTMYTATVTTGVKGTNGKALSPAKTWSFTTSACPCSLMSSLTPTLTGLPVRDGRSGAGPWTYEMGTKIQVSQAASLTAVRFYKDAAEIGTHVGRVWTSDGQQLASVTFSGETASGWQQATLSTPVAMTAGVTYVVSVGLNNTFVMTSAALRNQLASGPLLSVADGANGVYAPAAGTFPTSSYNASNYFVDAVVQ